MKSNNHTPLPYGWIYRTEQWNMWNKTHTHPQIESPTGACIHPIKNSHWKKQKKNSLIEFHKSQRCGGFTKNFNHTFNMSRMVWFRDWILQTYRYQYRQYKAKWIILENLINNSVWAISFGLFSECALVLDFHSDSLSALCYCAIRVALQWLLVSKFYLMLNFPIIFQIESSFFFSPSKCILVAREKVLPSTKHCMCDVQSPDNTIDTKLGSIICTQKPIQ